MPFFAKLPRNSRRGAGHRAVREVDAPVGGARLAGPYWITVRKDDPRSGIAVGQAGCQGMAAPQPEME